jgi:hypothetical protein
MDAEIEEKLAEVVAAEREMGASSEASALEEMVEEQEAANPVTEEAPTAAASESAPTASTEDDAAASEAVGDETAPAADEVPAGTTP